MARPFVSIWSYLTVPRRRLSISLEEARADAVSALTLAVVLLPQAIAFALVAGLPPQAGLATAVVGAVVGALWGSSSLVHTGPTSAVALLVLSSIAAAGAADPTAMVLVAGVLAVLAGGVQILLGVARLGILVNFVSDAVIVGFAAGAGVQIAVGEMRHVLGLEVPGRGLWTTLSHLVTHLPATHLPTLAAGAATIGVLVAVKRWRPTWPATLLALLVTSVVTGVLGPATLGISVLGALPQALPSPVALPVFDATLLTQLSTGALAVAAIGLIQTMAVARSLAAATGERLDANQEFVGQGLANVACGAFGGFAASGSFSRSAVAAETGARTPLAAILSGGFVLAAMLFLGPLGAYLPRAALAGVLVVVAVKMVDVAAIRRIARGSRGETVVLLITLVGTLALPIDIAVLAGILAALAHYVLQTSAPEVVPVLPGNGFRHFRPRGERTPCPQVELFDIRGDLYFGATTHVEDALRSHLDAHPGQRFVLLRLHGVNRLDVSGVRMLERLVRSLRERGGDLYLTRVQRPVLRFLIKTRFHEFLGRDHFLAPDGAIGHLFHRVLDPATCVYECATRAFRECQSIPRPDVALPLPVLTHAPPDAVQTMTPRALWGAMSGDGHAPHVVDVREPREFAQGHVPQADNVPLPRLLDALDAEPAFASGGLVLVCRGGRRSRDAAAALQTRGAADVRVLDGGMLAWESTGLLTAVGGRQDL